MRAIICISIALTAAHIWSQPAPPQVKSPEVSADGRITFRLYAPNARNVVVPDLVTDFRPPLVLTRDEHGVWSGTTGRMEPDFYLYHFLADGVAIVDPANPRVGWNRIDRGPFSEVHVPGPQSLSWELNNVIHGNVIHHFYHSNVIGDDRDFYVYTPPGYDPSGKTQYPVLYLLHGAGTLPDSWMADVRINVILDNLISQRKAKPMIIVAPLSYGSATANAFLEGISKGFEKLSASVLNEVIPIVEKTYHVGNDRGARAIAGYSSGGSQSFYIGLNHLDKFAYIAGFSSALITLPGPVDGRPPLPSGPSLPPLRSDWFPAVFPNLDAQLSLQIRLVWLSCGTEDRLIGHNRQFRDWLQSRKVRLKYTETPGGHTPMVWRRNLTELAQLLFQENK